MGRYALGRVVAPHFVAGVIWEKKEEWVCVETAPILKWMVGKKAPEVKKYLDKKGWKTEWI